MAAFLVGQVINYCRDKASKRRWFVRDLVTIGRLAAFSMFRLAKLAEVQPELESWRAKAKSLAPNTLAAKGGLFVP